MMPRLLESSREAGGGSYFYIQHRQNFLALRRIILWNCPIGLRVDLIKQMNERALRVVLRVKSGLDAERRIDRNRRRIAGRRPAHRVADEPSLILIGRDEISLADVGR